jgi:hypothetical protein
MRADIVPGGVFPDYTLPDHTGVVRTLSELQGRDPLVLTLARGHYCPKEHQQHLELAAFQPKIAVAYTQIVRSTNVPWRASARHREAGDKRPTSAERCVPAAVHGNSREWTLKTQAAGSRHRARCSSGERCYWARPL